MTTTSSREPREGVTEMGIQASEPYQLGDTDYAIPPGETLRELLNELGFTQRDLARRADLSPKHVNRLLQGLVPLSPEVAQRLEHVTGTPARIWNRLQANYQSDLQRLRNQRDLARHSSWLSELPVSALVERGVLPSQPADKASRVEQMLSFFGVASVDAWDDVYRGMACSFRQSKAYEVKPGSVAAWLRLGEIAAQDIRCNPYDRHGLRAALPSLRALTSEPPEVFSPELQRICASYGMAVVFVEEITGARASGATRWLTGRKALIQLSLRYRTDDHLWFTFFHEVAHVLLHGKKELIIEDSRSAADDSAEAEADQFSRDLLIPPSAAGELAHLTTAEAVREFADRIGISPGIVVGRLQHDGYWPHSRGHQLKRKLALADTGADTA
jgi:HTH-type transcriptional regulator / antitoxin HigA